MDDARRCKARNRSGERCKRSAIKGGFVCASHGGRAPQVKRAAARRQVEQQARTALDVRGAPSVTDPIAELERLAGEVVQFKDSLAGAVANVREIRYAGQISEQIRGEVSALLTAMERSEKVLTSLARLDLDARRVQIDESKALLMAHVIKGVLAAHGLDVDAPKVRHLIAVELERAPR